MNHAGRLDDSSRAREDCWCAENDLACFEHYDGADDSEGDA